MDNMSIAEMKEILKSKIEKLPDENVEKIFPAIIDVIENARGQEIDLSKYADGIFRQYHDLMKKLA